MLCHDHSVLKCGLPVNPVNKITLRGNIAMSPLSRSSHQPSFLVKTIAIFSIAFALFPLKAAFADYVGDSFGPATKVGPAQEFEGPTELPNSNTPPATDCDNDSEKGRVFVDNDATTARRWYVCEGAANGWVAQGATSPCGAAGLIQYSDGSAFDCEEGLTFTESTNLVNINEATDGDFVGLRIDNDLANAGSSTNETAQLRFGFGSDTDVARIKAGKYSDFTSSPNSNSFLSFNVDDEGTSTEVMRAATAASGGGALGVNIGKTSIPLAALDIVGFGENIFSAQTSSGANSLLLHSNGQAAIFGGQTSGRTRIDVEAGSSASASLALVGETTSSTPATLGFGYSSTGAYGDYTPLAIMKWTQGGTRPGGQQAVLTLAHSTSGVSNNAPLQILLNEAGNRTGLTLEDTHVLIAGNASTTYSHGLADGTTLTDYRHVRIEAPVINGVVGGGTETVTNAATVHINAAPSGSDITFTNAPSALWSAAGQVRFDGAEATDAILALFADNGDDAADKWSIKSLASGNSLDLVNDATVVDSFSSAGKLSTYNSIATVSNGVPSEVATIDTTGLTANVAAATLYSVPSSGEGMYRVSAYVVLTTAGSISSTLPNVQVVYTDKDSNASVTLDATPVLGAAGLGQTGALTANTVGTVDAGVVAIYVKASTTIQYQTVNYASVAAGMTYALHIKLEAM